MTRVSDATFDARGVSPGLDQPLAPGPAPELPPESALEPAPGLTTEPGLGPGLAPGGGGDEGGGGRGGVIPDTVWLFVMLVWALKNQSLADGLRSVASGIRHTAPDAAALVHLMSQSFCLCGDVELKYAFTYATVVMAFRGGGPPDHPGFPLLQCDRTRWPEWLGTDGPFMCARSWLSA